MRQVQQRGQALWFDTQFPANLVVRPARRHEAQQPCVHLGQASQRGLVGIGHYGVGAGRITVVPPVATAPVDCR